MVVRWSQQMAEDTSPASLARGLEDSASATSIVHVPGPDPATLTAGRLYAGMERLVPFWGQRESDADWVVDAFDSADVLDFAGQTVPADTAESNPGKRQTREMG